jgi:hypothetical protein
MLYQLSYAREARILAVPAHRPLLIGSATAPVPELPRRSESDRHRVKGLLMTAADGCRADACTRGRAEPL